MDTANPSPFVLLIRAARPLRLLVGILMYALGVGIHVYLGDSLNWTVYWLGQATVTLLQLSSYLLRIYFDALQYPQYEQPLNPQKGSKGHSNRNPVLFPPRNLAIQLALTTLVIGAVLTVLLYQLGVIKILVLVVLGIAFGLAFFYAVPPFRLVYSGYGELTETVLVATLFPALGYLYQSGEIHRLLPVLTFPLAVLYLAMLLAISLRDYASDLNYRRKSLMIRLGWQHGMNLHNVLVISAYLLVGAAFLVGLPWGLTWPGLLTLPIGVFQVWQVVQISEGAPTRWRLLMLTAGATFGLTAYFLTLSLWIG